MLTELLDEGNLWLLEKRFRQKYINIIEKLTGKAIHGIYVPNDDIYDCDFAGMSVPAQVSRAYDFMSGNDILAVFVADSDIFALQHNYQHYGAYNLVDFDRKMLEAMIDMPYDSVPDESKQLPLWIKLEKIETQKVIDVVPAEDNGIALVFLGQNVVFNDYGVYFGDSAQRYILHKKGREAYRVLYDFMQYKITTQPDCNGIRRVADCIVDREDLSLFFGRDRLGYSFSTHPSQNELGKISIQLACSVICGNVNIIFHVYDWFCQHICTVLPKCGECPIRSYCNYQESIIKTT